MSSQEKRLFVGGLFDGVDKNDLQERFGQFGSVADIDVRKRLDEEGNPLKVFAYVNIRISDQNYKKCLQLYNRTKWRGRKVQIQVAKESFIDRLKRERQAAEQASVSKSGTETVSKPSHEDVQKLKVKGAVPGTAIEGKQDWVVGKYGRPMPVVKIRRKDKQKVVKIDPSHYTHTIKKLKGDNQDIAQSVNNLSWFAEEDGRQPKSINGGKNLKEDSSSSSESSDDDDSSNTAKRKRKKTASKKKVGLSNPSNSVSKKRKKKYETSSDESYSESSSDEREPVRPSKKSSQTMDNELHQQSDYQDFEIVSINKKVNGHGDGPESDDSADTDELLSHMKGSNGKKDLDKLTSGQYAASIMKQTKAVTLESSASGSESEAENLSRRPEKKSVKKNLNSTSTASSDKSKKQELQVSQVHQLKLAEADPYDSSDSETPADILQRMATKDSKGQEDMSQNGGKKNEKKELGSKNVKDWIRIQSGGETKKVEKTHHKDSKSSQSESEKGVIGATKGKVTPNKDSTLKQNLKSTGSNTNDEFYGGHENFGEKNDETDDEEEDLLDLIDSGHLNKVKKLAKDIEESAGKTKATNTKEGTKRRVKEKKKKGEKGSKNVFISKEEKHALANEKRLESMKQRQKDHFSHQKLIKNALASLDQPEANKKIVFDSDSEDDLGESSTMMDTVGMESEKPKTNKSVEESGSGSKETSFEDEQSQSANQKSGLFESENDSEGEDEDMFRIRPEKEGAAGRKLMALQSRLGGDSRFKMDESFLEEKEEGGEDGEDGEMETNETDQDVSEEGVTRAEKEKSMAILAGIVGSKVTHMAKRDKRLVYRDLTSIQYDPAKEGHEKLEVTSEAKPKKKKEKKEVEAVKKKDPEPELPEVSKDKYFNVTSSLKDVFSSDTGFSFNFAVDRKDGSAKQAANASATSEKIATKDDMMNPQLQKQFRYDSSDDDEESSNLMEEEKDESIRTEKKDTKTTKTPGWGWSKETFFFTEDDSRIKESLEFFCQEEDGDKVRELWAEQRPALIEAYRMKRKRALRKSNEARKAQAWLVNKASRRRNFHPAKKARKI